MSLLVSGLQVYVRQLQRRRCQQRRSHPLAAVVWTRFPRELLRTEEKGKEEEEEEEQEHGQDQLEHHQYRADASGR